MIEELRSTVSNGGEIVLEFKCSSCEERLIGTACNEREGWGGAQTNLTEEVIGNSRTGPGVVGPNDDRGRTIAQHHQIDYWLVSSPARCGSK
jgi:hypothetical protein